MSKGAQGGGPGRTEPAGADLRRIRDLASRGNVIPVVREVPADLQTPVAAFLRTAGGGSHAFLLESVEGGEIIARYSFLGFEPCRLLRARGDRLEESEGEDASPRTSRGDALERLRDWLRPLRPVQLPDLPRFTGGLVGYLSYDAARWRERIPETVEDDLGVPDLEMGLYDSILAFDHLHHRILLIANLFTEGGDLEGKHGRALERLDAMEKGLRDPIVVPPTPAPGAPEVEVSNLPAGEFRRRVERAQEHIRAGDIFQVVLSQRFQRPVRVDPFQVYRALRRINPSPYMFFLRHGGISLCGASPEMLVRVEGSRIQTRPIAGTRRRGASPEEDEALERELSADPKEIAEHVMLVDLGRNDMGRVCQAGSVQVAELMKVERYSHVMHLVSALEGQLRDDVDALDALISCFPAGTVTGAPKVRAMEIIDELETHRRGPYAGAVAYLDYSGDLDSCITIRTLLFQGATAYAQAGAGVVADSSPAREETETEEKARVLLEATRLAEEGID